MTQLSLKWWQKTVVYQIYPRSYKDSTGNGIGDLPGIISKLDYLEELGIETIWFSPFFTSPQQDHGYDIKDFRSIDPVYGTMKDFDTLLERMHERKMKIVLDLVLNHTSDQHPWFTESASSRDNSKRDWYIWRDGKKPNGKAPPNNWKSMTSGPAWKYSENTDQWVYFHFLPFQPDLNYRNPVVKAEMFNVMKFWLDKGVDGFRLDILHSIYEDMDLRDNPWNLSIYSDKKSSMFFQKHIYDLNLPETFDFCLELRKIIDEYEPDRFLVGEVFGSVEQLRKYYGSKNNGLNQAFLFDFTSKALSFNVKKIKNVIKQIESALPYPYTPTYVYGNHDRDRYLSLLKGNIEKAKLFATMQLTLRGVPYIYYGEEIGMKNVKFELKISEDPIGKKFANFPYPQITNLIGFSLTRDRCRTPMQWNSKYNAGFSTNNHVKPWLKISDNFKEVNVELEREQPESLLNLYKKLILLRKENIALQEGIFKFIELKDKNRACIAYKRLHQEQNLSIYLNFSKREIFIDAVKDKTSLLFSTIFNKKILELNPSNEKIKINPFEGIILI
ncbi:MAG: alpha-glucosidase [Candidatus Hermodarchaeota archaeon]